MAIIALANSKGGCGKSTLAQCLSYSVAFKKKYKRIALVELDRQGTLNAWHTERPDTDDSPVSFSMIYSTNARQAADMLTAIYKSTDAMVLDLPGESEKGFATGFGIRAADVVVVPLRNSTADLNAFGAHLLPGLSDLDAFGKTLIVPSMVHPATNQAKMRETFQDFNFPEGVRISAHCFPMRKIYENYGVDGETLSEYAKTCRTNKSEHARVRAAIQDIERIAKGVIKHAR